MTRLIARATVTLENDPKFGGTRDEVATIEETDDGEIRIEVEHYDGFHATYLSRAAWNDFRAQIIERGGDEENNAR